MLDNFLDLVAALPGAVAEVVPYPVLLGAVVVGYVALAVALGRLLRRRDR